MNRRLCLRLASLLLLARICFAQTDDYAGYYEDYNLYEGTDSTPTSSTGSDDYFWDYLELEDEV